MEGRDPGLTRHGQYGLYICTSICKDYSSSAVRCLQVNNKYSNQRTYKCIQVLRYKYCLYIKSSNIM